MVSVGERVDGPAVGGATDGHAGPQGRAPAVPPDRVRALLAAYGDHPSIGLALNPGMRYFTDRRLEGIIAYRTSGRYAFQFGGVFAPHPDRAPLLHAFLDLTQAGRLRLCAVQVRDHDVDLYHRAGFRLNQIGLSYTVRLDAFETRGTRFMKLRNKVRRAAAAGVEVGELGRDLPLTPAVRVRLDDITRAWVRAKGRLKKVYDFLVGDLDAVWREGTRGFLALRGGAPIAFITYVPSYGRYPGFLHDLTRRLPDSPPGVMELINLTAITRFRAEGVPYLNLGFTPFAGVADRLGSHSRAVARLIRLLSRHGSPLYPAAAQVAYKAKWAPQIVEPEYLAFQERFRPGCLWQLLRLTRSI